jgi:hypothetical protein
MALQGDSNNMDVMNIVSKQIHATEKNLSNFNRFSSTGCPSCSGNG